MGRIFDIVEHPNVGSDELAYREPQSGSGDFRMGSQVIVRDNQVAVFVRNGQALDVLSGGTHTITTGNVPLLVNLIGKIFSNQTPFKAEVYFVNIADFPQIGWGTSQALALETPGKGLGWLLLQGYGVMDVHVGDPQRFARQYALGKLVVRIGDVKERLLTLVLGELQDTIAKYAPGDLMGLNRMINEIEATVLVRLRDKFDAVGLVLKAFEMTPLSAVKTTAEDLRGMGLLDVATYQALQAADALRDAAQNPGGVAGAGVGFGAGIGLGQAMAGAFAGQRGASETTSSAAGNVKAPETVADIQALLDSLDVRLSEGEIDLATYDKLTLKWQGRMKSMK